MSTANVFDGLNEDGKTVPVVIQDKGERKIVGQAHLTQNGDYIHAEVDFKSDAPQDVIDFLSTGITGLSPLPTEEDLDIAHTEALFEFEPHDHIPVQHRDGREPWCNECGLNENKHSPKSFMPEPAKPKGRVGKPKTNFGFPEPAGFNPRKLSWEDMVE